MKKQTQSILNFKWQVLLKYLEDNQLKTWEEFKAFEKITGKKYFECIGVGFHTGKIFRSKKPL